MSALFHQRLRSIPARSCSVGSGVRVAGTTKIGPPTPTKYQDTQGIQVPLRLLSDNTGPRPF